MEANTQAAHKTAGKGLQEEECGKAMLLQASGGGREHSMYELEATRGLSRGQGGTGPDLNSRRQVGAGRHP